MRLKESTSSARPSSSSVVAGDGEGGSFAFCLFGAAPDTRNLGVSALCESAVRGLRSRFPRARITVFDHGRGMRPAAFDGDEAATSHWRCGAYLTRRVHRPESFAAIEFWSRIGGGRNPAARALRQATAVLDVSGGDSFTDLYGLRRFRSICRPKELALRLGKKLILLPQTYGPFFQEETRRQAAWIIEQADQAWARDPRSYELLRELAGGRLDPDRHKLGVDIAFALPLRQPHQLLPDQVLTALERRDNRPLAGVNISGLIYNGGAEAKAQYRFRAEYASVVHRLVARLVEQADATVILIPHVLARPGLIESDQVANESAFRALDRSVRRRVLVCPPVLSASQSKWLISQMDWFCGTRMHSTIAGLSTTTPTAGVAYSVKAQGVFERCGAGEALVDPRSLDTEQTLEALWALWERRETMRQTLQRTIPEVLHAAETQMDAIAAAAVERERTQ